MTVIEVDPNRLRAAAAEVEQAVDLVGAVVGGGHLTGLPDPSQAGWTTTAALAPTVQVWSLFLHRLHDDLTRSATGLRAAADTFVAAEWSAAQRQRRGGGYFDE
jgi:hypothetical protein